MANLYAFRNQIINESKSSGQGVDFSQMKVPEFCLKRAALGMWAQNGQILTFFEGAHVHCT